jgi:hypothetical protein
MINVPVRIGNAPKMAMDDAKTDQVNKGISLKRMEGVRIFKIVTAKLSPEAKLPIPEI